MTASDRTKYSFGDSDIARERLAIVADTFEAPTRLLLADLPPMQPRYVVDMGCGPGHTSALLQLRFPHSEVTGLDSSAAMVDEIRVVWPDGAEETFPGGAVDRYLVLQRGSGVKAGVRSP